MAISSSEAAYLLRLFAYLVVIDTDNPCSFLSSGRASLENISQYLLLEKKEDVKTYNAALFTKISKRLSFSSSASAARSTCFRSPRSAINEPNCWGLSEGLVFNSASMAPFALLSERAPM